MKCLIPLVRKSTNYVGGFLSATASQKSKRFSLSGLLGRISDPTMPKKKETKTADNKRSAAPDPLGDVPSKAKKPESSTPPSSKKIPIQVSVPRKNPSKKPPATTPTSSSKSPKLDTTLSEDEESRGPLHINSGAEDDGAHESGEVSSSEDDCSSSPRSKSSRELHAWTKYEQEMCSKGIRPRLDTRDGDKFLNLTFELEERRQQSQWARATVVKIATKSKNDAHSSHTTGNIFTDFMRVDINHVTRRATRDGPRPTLF